MLMRALSERFHCDMAAGTVLHRARASMMFTRMTPLLLHTIVGDETVHRRFPYLLGSLT
jgi:hypothetical protein